MNGVAILTTIIKKATRTRVYFATWRAHIWVMPSVFITSHVLPNNA